jgi:hypothetical protein
MGESRFNPNKRKYGKRNFVELLENLVPEIYKYEDLQISGAGDSFLTKVINSNLNIAKNIAKILPISAIEFTQTSSLNNISGISQYFVKQNELTKINPYSFETDILIPLGKSIVNFATSGAFNDYLSGTLLPIIQNDNACLIDNISSLSALTNDVEPSSVHNYLVDALGWFYFLNTSGGADDNRDFDPSSYVLSAYNTLYRGNTLKTVDGVKGITNLIWKNYGLSTTFAADEVVPNAYLSGTALYTSGTQSLEKLEEMLEVIYSPLYIDDQDFTVENAFNEFMNAGLYVQDLVSKGPQRKYLEGIGFEMADIMDQVDSLDLIYDVENTPDEYLQYIAQIVGWKLFGGSSDRWREQIRNAVKVYKRKGTLESIQFVVNSLIKNSVFDVSGNVQELWESYLPFLIWYALATESPYFAKLERWPKRLATRAGVYTYSPSSLTDNIKLTVDSILLDLYKEYPEHFIFFGDRFPVYKFVKVNPNGTAGDLYTCIYEPNPKPYHYHARSDRRFNALRKQAIENGEYRQWVGAQSFGPFGPGVYMAEDRHPSEESRARGEKPIYLSATGDPYFVFSFRQQKNYPIPPFEQIKYYKDCTITWKMLKFLMKRLACFAVKKKFRNDMENYVVSSVVEASSNLRSLNEWLFFDLSSQQPPNYHDILRNITSYPYNVLGLWNGKSSHLFVDYDNTDFDFAKTTLEGDSKTALYEASRIIKRFVPAHAIPRINLNASANDDHDVSSTIWDYVNLDKGENGFPNLGTCSVLAGYECSGVDMAGPPGSHSGRDAFNTFKRGSVDTFEDRLISSSVVSVAAPRRALRRRNYRFLLPEDGYYDRGGFNGPINWDASTMETSLNDPSNTSGLGELTLGYLYSANSFYPTGDTGNLSGVWHQCEDLGSPRSFSGAATSKTYPYRGLSSSPLVGMGRDEWTRLGNYRHLSTWGGDVDGRISLNQATDVDATIVYVSVLDQAGVNHSVSANQVGSMFSPGNAGDGDKIALVCTTDSDADVGKRLVYSVTGTPTLANTGGSDDKWYYSIPVTYAYGNGESFLGNNTDYAEVYLITTEPGQAHNQDRGQLPPIYATMHRLYELKALDMASALIASDPSAYSASSYWRDCAQSIANSGIASGYGGLTFDSYRDFKFGRGVHKTFEDYCYYFKRHDLGRNEMFNSGGNIFGQIFGRLLYNSDFAITGRYAHPPLGGSFIASSTEDSNPIAGGPSGVFSMSAVHAANEPNGYASGTYIASAASQMVLPLSGEFRAGRRLNAEYRNADIISGVEFVQTSGAPSSNEFRIFKLDPSFAAPEQENFLIRNTVIKQKSHAGLPRIRFDLSSYGPRRNYMIKDHTFSLDVSALVSEDNKFDFGGERMGIWIHTNVTSGYMWSFVPNSSDYVTYGNRLVDGRWIPHKEEDLSIAEVTNKLSFIHNFRHYTRNENEEDYKCLGNIDLYGSNLTNQKSLGDILSTDFANINIKFDTRNFSIYNNMEYSEIIPVPEEIYKLKDEVNTDATNYYVEIFLLPTVNRQKYLLIDDIKLQDVTQRDNASIGTNHGIPTKGTPLRPFVKEDKLELSRDDVQAVLKFFTGLMGSGVGVYATDYASRDKAITDPLMGRRGGGRLNYRLHPYWMPYKLAAALAGSTPSTDQLIDLEVRN